MPSPEAGVSASKQTDSARQPDKVKNDSDTAGSDDKPQPKLTVPPNFPGGTAADNAKIITDTGNPPGDAKAAPAPGTAPAADAARATAPVAVGGDGTRYFQISDDKIAAVTTDNKYTFMRSLPSDLKPLGTAPAADNGAAGAGGAPATPADLNKNAATGGNPGTDNTTRTTPETPAAPAAEKTAFPRMPSPERSRSGPGAAEKNPRPSRTPAGPGPR